jgi:Arc/MetJ family transcription regulator
MALERTVVFVKWWVKVAGTGQSAYTQARWDERRERMQSEGSGRSLFAKRPRIQRGDRFLIYAAGSAAEYGEGRFFAIEEVLSHEPEPSGHERWRWQMQTRLLAAVDELARAPALREIGVSPKSLRQHSHIRLSDEQGRLGLRLVEEAAGSRRA